MMTSSLPPNWSVTPLGEHVRITSGESPSLFEFVSDGTPYFKVEQLGSSNKYLGHESTPYQIRTAKTVPPHSVVFAKRGAAISLNRIRVLRQDSYMDTNLMALTPSDDLSVEYLYYGLGHIGLWQLADTTSVPQINNKHIQPLPFPLPPIKEQRAIAEALSDVDALLAGLDRLIAKKRDLKQAAMQQFLTGKVRLPGFRTQWAKRSLGELGRCLRGVAYRADIDLFPHDLPNTKRLLRSNNIQESIVRTTDVQFVSSERVTPDQVLQRSDILICMANGSRALVGKAGLFQVSDGYDYTFGAFMGCFRTHSSEAKPEYLFYLFQTERYRDYINNLLAGSAINNLSPSSIESLEFLMPSIDEQAAVAFVLSDMDGELAALEARRSKTQALKQAMMQELLTGRIRLI